MKFSKKASYILLAFLAMLNIIFRYPTTPHEIGVDSFFIHGLANSISTFGYAEWILHPLSFFGLYPLSYPSAVPTILSIVSQASGLDVEYVILLFGFVLGILGMFGAYIMALAIRKDYLFAFLVAFAFSLSPLFIEFTRWTISTRNLFVALLPLLIWSLLCFHNRNQSKWKYLLLALIVLVVLGSTHRMFLLIPLVIIAYFVTIGIQFIKNLSLEKKALSKKHNTLYMKHKLTERKVFLISIMLFAFAFLMQFSNISFYKGIWWDYQTGALFEGTSPLILILNMSTNYMGHIGILILFGLVGLLFLLRKQNKDFGELFVLVTLLFFTSISALGLYISFFILPFASVLIAIGLLETIRIVEHSVTTDKLNGKIIKNNGNAKTKTIVFSVITISLILSMCFSAYLINRHMHLPTDTGDKMWMNDRTYNTGLFLKEGGEDKPFLSNDYLVAGRIRAVLGVPCFSGGIYGLIHGFTNDEELEFRPINLLHVKGVSTRTIYLLVNRPNIDRDVRMVYRYDCDDNRFKQITYKYDIEYVVMNNRILEKRMGTRSKFMTSIYKKETKVYDNKEESVWRI